ncbi:MAG: hypothetical protein GX951_00205 [Mollicutes bacterium]|nr:hypothetical protein [Mollicutes bacterium]
MLFFKEKLDIEMLTYNFVLDKDNNHSYTYKIINNHIICTKKTLYRFPMKKNKDGNYTLNLKKIFNITKNDELEKCFGSKFKNQEVLIGVDEDDLYHIYFKTLKNPPYKFMEYCLKKFKQSIVWFAMPLEVTFATQSRAYYYEDGKIVSLIEKSKSKKEIQYLKENKYEIGYFLPYKYVFKGNYIDAYSTELGKEKYICSCYKRAIECKIKMFDYNLKDNYSVKKQKKAFLKFLGLPEYYNNKILEYNIQNKYEECLSIFNYKDKLCPICNNVRPLRYQSEKSFDLAYKQEFEKRCSLNGIVLLCHNQGKIFYMESLLSNKAKKILNFNDDDILKELKGKKCDFDIKKELKKFNNLPLKDKKNIKCNLTEDITNIKKLDSAFVKKVQNVFLKRYKLFLNSINKELKKYHKDALSSKRLFKPEFGINIYLINKNNFLKISLDTDIIVFTDYYNKKKNVFERKSNVKLFANVMEIISSEHLTIGSNGKSYNQYFITNGKKQKINKRDGVKGDYNSVGLNHAIIKIRSYLNPKEDEVIIKLIDYWLL